MANITASESYNSVAIQSLRAERFEFSEAELAALMGPLNLQPIAESPLKGIRPLGDAESDRSPAIAYQTREALERLARPEIKLDLVYCAPPEPALVATYYGVDRDGDFVLHEHHPDGRHRLAYPVNAFSVFETGARVLQLERAAETSGFTQVLDRAAFEAMSGIVDLIQEHTLSRMLQRKLPAGELVFSGDDIAECCARSLETMDSRWMVPRAMLAAPLPLSFRATDIRRGLEWLLDAGALRAEGKQYGLKSVFSLVCSRLISCLGLFVVSTNRLEIQGKDSKRWLHEHCAGLRCAGGLWQLEFFDITASDFKATLLDVTPHMLYGRLTAAIFPPQAMSLTETTDELRTEEPQQKHCPQCNAVLKAGKKFCTQCGTAITRL